MSQRNSGRFVIHAPGNGAIGKPLSMEEANIFDDEDWLPLPIDDNTNGIATGARASNGSDQFDLSLNQKLEPSSDTTNGMYITDNPPPLYPNRIVAPISSTRPSVTSGVTANYYNFNNINNNSMINGNISNFGNIGNIGSIGSIDNMCNSNNMNMNMNNNNRNNNNNNNNMSLNPISSVFSSLLLPPPPTMNENYNNGMNQFENESSSVPSLQMLPMNEMNEMNNIPPCIESVSPVFFPLKTENDNRVNCNSGGGSGSGSGSVHASASGSIDFHDYSDEYCQKVFTLGSQYDAPRMPPTRLFNFYDESAAQLRLPGISIGNGNTTRSGERQSIDSQADSSEVALQRRQFQCHFCKKWLASAKSLRNHIKRIHHQSELPYKCHVCEKGFVLQANLQRHVASHSIDRPFGCQLCSKRFKKNYSLQNHIKLVHLHIKKFQCDVCERSFGKKHDLKRHKERVHDQENENGVECQHCGKPFKVKEYLKKHMKNIHPEAL